MRRTLSLMLCLTFIFASLLTPFIGTVVAQQSSPTYGGNVEFNESVNADNEIKFSVNNGSTIYPGTDFSIKFNAKQNTPDNWNSLSVFLFDVSYTASWLNDSVNVYRWSLNDPANLNDDDPTPQSSIQTTIQLTEVPKGNQQIEVTCYGGGYLLITHDEGQIFQTFYKNTTSTLLFTVSGSTPATPKPTVNDEAILWETNVQWNLTGTPAQNYWETDIYSKNRIWTPPVVVDDLVYAAAKSTVTLNSYGHPEVSWVTVYAFNILNGATVWKYQGNYSTTTITDLAVTNGVLYFGASDYVIALNATTGKALWKTTCTTGYSNPAVAGEKVFIGSGNSLIALDANEGTILWNFTTNDAVVASPAASTGVVFIGSNDRNMYAVNTENGQKIWSFQAEGAFIDTPTIGDGVIYAPSADGNMYALRTTEGSKVWSFDTSPSKVDVPAETDQTFEPSAPTLVNGILYFTSSGSPYNASSQKYDDEYGTIYAFSTGTAQMVWSKQTSNVCSRPVVVDGLVYVNIFPQRLEAFQANDGTSVWNFSNAETVPAVANGVVYFAYNDQILAVKTPEGDFSNLPFNVEYSLNFPMLAVLSFVIISLTVLIIYNFKYPLNQKIKLKPIKSSLKGKLFKKKEKTENHLEP